MNEPAPHAASPSPPAVQPTFALVFRAAPRTLSPDELQKRKAAAIAWALPLRDSGVLVQTVLLADGGAGVASDGAVAPLAPTGAIAAFTVVRAVDLAAAVALARSHPGLSFGTTIEVRPVQPLPPTPR